MYALSIVIGIALFLICPFHLLGDDSNPDYGEKGSNFCPAPSDPTIRVPDWVCGAPVAGYPEVGVGIGYQTDGFSEEEDYFSSRNSAFVSAFAFANLEILRQQKTVISETPTHREITSGKIKSKIIEKFFTPTEVHILVAEAPDGDNYKLDAMYTEIISLLEIIDDTAPYTGVVRMIKYNADESEVVWCYQHYFEIKGENFVEVENFSLGTCQKKPNWQYRQNFVEVENFSSN